MKFLRKESEQEGMQHCAESAQAVPTRGCLPQGLKPLNFWSFSARLPFAAPWVKSRALPRTISDMASSR